jgi:hypothetical protein
VNPSTNKLILVNAFGIVDSGGTRVLEKFLTEASRNDQFTFEVFCYFSEDVEYITKTFPEIKFNIRKRQNIIMRLLYENIVFKYYELKGKFDLIYNFSGSAQFTISASKQIIKIHNLLFYSKKLDHFYYKQGQRLTWLKQVFIKRCVFLQMIKKAQHLEVQSEHVAKALEDFVDMTKKRIWIKSDVVFDEPRLLNKPKYKLKEKITFLYIVGNHFAHINKNIGDFVNAMVQLQGENIEFEIKITASREHLTNSSIWNDRLTPITEFLGYIQDKNQLYSHFKDNTILISTSIIETLGLHVFEAINHNVLCVVPNEPYSNTLYGPYAPKYELGKPNNMVTIILEIFSKNRGSIEGIIAEIRNYIITREQNKFASFIEILQKI